MKMGAAEGATQMINVLRIRIGTRIQKSLKGVVSVAGGNLARKEEAINSHPNNAIQQMMIWKQGLTRSLDISQYR
jgi:hypothetical protein